MQLISNSPQDTDKIAKILTDKILNTKAGKTAIVVALEGELGAGKTTLVKAIAKTLGIKSHITSPTFVLMKKYEIPLSVNRLLTIARKKKPSGHSPSAISHKQLIHIDTYRLKDYQDLVAIGVKEIISDPKNIVLIEWSERVKPILPNKKIKVHIDHTGETQRKFLISNF